MSELHGVGGQHPDNQDKDKKRDRGQVIEEEAKAPSKLEKTMSKFKQIFKLGAHHKMERFTILFVLAFSFMMVFATSAWFKHRGDVSTAQATNTVFTKEARFSKSQETMKVLDVYGNEEQTDVMVLLQFNNPANMSMDAETYELYLTGLRKELKHPPKTTFNIFGSTGYAMIRFQDAQGIYNEVVDITIRANANLAQGDEAKIKSDERDGTFAVYDQARIAVNPGAAGIRHINIKSGEDDPILLYQQLVAIDKDKEYREKIQGATGEIKKLLNRSDEYRSRIIASGFIPPKTPWFIDGDRVTQREVEVKDEETGEMVKEEVDVFEPADYVARAHRFDYVEHTIEDGYMYQVVNNLTEFREYMKKHQELSESIRSSNDEFRAKPEKVEIPKTLMSDDGSTLYIDRIVTGTSTSDEIALKNDLQQLTTTWSSYITQKGRLQRDYMRNLLLLDADVQSQTRGFTTLDDDKHIVFY